MKRGTLLLSVFVLILTVGFVSAQACSSADQVIFKASDSINAHVGDASSSYTESVCFDNIFENSFAGININPQVCDGSNAVLKVSGSSNAHAGSTGSVYTREICYGDLDCRTVGYQVECGAGEATLAFLSDTDNAHVAFNSAGGAYGSKICCSSASGGNLLCGNGNVDSGESCDDSNLIDDDGCSSACQLEMGVVSQCGNGVVELNEICDDGNTVGGDGCSATCISEASAARWTSFGNTDNEIRVSYLGNKVKLVIETGFPSGTNVDFEVFEDDGILGRDSITILSASADSSGLAVAELEITQAVINGGGDEQVSEFEFDATVGSQTERSGILRVDKTDQDPVNNYPNVEILTPVSGIYNVDESISFSHLSSDEETASDDLMVQWDFGDGSTSTDDGPTHSYSSSGVYEIVLSVTDEDSNTQEASVSVLVVDQGDNMFVFIEDPSHREVIIDSDLRADISSLDSYAINVNLDANSLVLSAECLAGNCPSSTFGGITVDDPNSKDGDYGALFYDWSISENGNVLWNITGLGKTGETLTFASSGKKKLDLVLSYPNEGGLLSNSAERIFTVYDERQCIDSGFSWLEVSSEGRIVAEHDTRRTDACKGGDGSIGTSDDCCPAGWECTANGCQLAVDDLTELDCNFYTLNGGEDACEADVLQAAEFDPVWDVFDCGTVNDDGDSISCACEWNPTAGVCGLEKTEESFIVDPTISPISCLYSSTVSDCDTQGFQEVSIVNNCGEDPSTAQVRCQESTIELPFFGIGQLLTSMLTIFFVYLIIGMVRRK